MTDTTADREEIVEAYRRVAALGLVSGASGNVSKRLDDGRFAITPRGATPDRLTAAEVVVIDERAEPVEDNGVPSSESLVHLAVYAARPDVGAVIHTHSVWASALAVAGLEIPALIDEQVVLLGGPVAVAAYAAPMSEELAANTLAALGDRRAVLLRNHGVVGVGSGLAQAVDVVELVERLAHTFTLARLLGVANPLPADLVQLEQDLYRMSTFGAQP